MMGFEYGSIRAKEILKYSEYLSHVYGQVHGLNPVDPTKFTSPNINM